MKLVTKLEGLKVEKLYVICLRKITTIANLTLQLSNLPTFKPSNFNYERIQRHTHRP